jgi:lipid II:glycine glycyltransferase (peptidoglycan interpeptide bridge formation enzyme)
MIHPQITKRIYVEHLYTSFKGLSNVPFALPGFNRYKQRLQQQLHTFQFPIQTASEYFFTLKFEQVNKSGELLPNINVLMTINYNIHRTKMFLDETFVLVV